ncbi:MAG TPA: acetate/propionate family kinase [Geminicoccaceae bacterium]|jgi:acetate kinase|nr:acetate/propionate family kinase [Geminicoccaceae bacterium]
MTDAVLTINAGSSSLKFSVYGIGDDGRPTLSAKGQVEGIGTSPRLVAEDAAGRVLVDRRWPDDRGSGHAEFFRVIGGWLREQFSDAALLGVGHRVVHGGVDHAAPVRVDPAVLTKLEALCSLAPLHQPHNLAGIRAVAAVQPDLPQVACFDTAFHRNHSELADWFALPRRFHDEGIRRYGFHGLSYEYIASVLPDVAPEIARGRVVVAHLGSGASMCAMSGGRSIDSTMGFTALDGLPMGTRCGALDPGVVLHLIRAYGMDADAVERMLYHDCGLKGVSGISNDMRALLASDDPRAAQAVELFVWRIARELGALAAVLGGADGLVFTAGIGERSAEIRKRVCEKAAWLGIELDHAANARRGPRISADGSRVAVYAIPTDEEQMIARHTLAVLRRAPPPGAA